VVTISQSTPQPSGPASAAPTIQSTRQGADYAGKPRATTWQLRTKVLAFGELPAIMGIVNVTPDSFSDGGHYLAAQAAIDHALRLEDAGADLLDIGGESTRPYSQPVSAADELRRVEPVLEALIGRVACPVSIDTSKSLVARAAIQLGAEIINDVTGLSGDREMIALAAQTKAAVCAMHMPGTPQNMQDAPCYQNVVEDIAGYLSQRLDALIGSGIEERRICLDPGIGFGKTHQHNLDLVIHSARFLEIGRPILVGHSRKGFIGKLINSPSVGATDRMAGTVGISLALARHGVQVLRVHDVAATRDALVCFAAGGGLS
jgi:dihydropteroate synthase